MAFASKIGIIAVRSLQNYFEKKKVDKCYIITEVNPHNNVIKYLKNLKKIEINITDNINQEIDKIVERTRNKKIKLINLDDFGEKNMMRDVD